MNPPTDPQESLAHPESSAVENYLNILQSVVARMANNSNNCKAWCVTLVSALLVVLVDKDQSSYGWIALVPIVLFCFLDAYYLGLERGFRGTYNDFVKRLHSGAAPMSDVYKVVPVKGWNVVQATGQSITSFAIYPFYGSLLIITVFAYVFTSL
ncbi:MAG: hypothetical protein AAF703_03945 [Cyanobacteria bacterium P01_D01_bin.105]